MGLGASRREGQTDTSETAKVKGAVAEDSSRTNELSLNLEDNQTLQAEEGQDQICVLK